MGYGGFSFSLYASTYASVGAAGGGLCLGGRGWGKASGLQRLAMRSILG